MNRPYTEEVDEEELDLLTLDLLPTVLLLSKLIASCDHLTPKGRQRTLDRMIEALVDDHRRHREEPT